MAMSLSLAVTAGAATLGDYSDSEQVTAKYATAVDFASQLGILEGFTDGKYHPQGTLTRAQLATMVYRMTTADVNDVYTANFAGGAAEAFSDTAATAWYAGYVGYAADAELLKGLGDGTYAPDAALTGYAALAAFLRGVGYDEPGYNFVGADWTVEVAKVAKQAGALAGITNVDLNKPITREVAAQMIYNIMFSDMVAYTPAFGYQEGILGAGDTLAADEFYIVSDKDGDAANIAPWGRPATIWVAKEGTEAATAAVTIAAEPVATYKTAVNQCDLSKELGKTGTWKAEQWLNGDNKGETNIDATAIKSDVAGTAQGTLTEVYKVGSEYEIVEIQTWMAEVTNVVKAVYDRNGHVTQKAETTLKAWNNENVAESEALKLTFKAETEAFAKESYVLLNNSEFSGGAVTVAVEDAGILTQGRTVTYTPDLEKGVDYGVLNLTAATPVATGELTAYNNTTKTSTIGGTTYDWALKFGMGFVGETGKTYDVYVDFYGNVIGIKEPATVYSYGVITKMAWADSYLPLDDAQAYANIMDFTASAENNVVMDNYKGMDFTGINTDAVATAAPQVSTDADNNKIYYDYAFQFKTLSDGSKAVTASGTRVAGVDIEKAVSNLFAAKAATNDNTVYLVKTGNVDDGYTYTSYTGYKTVPSMENVTVTYFAADNYVTYIFVDATKATFTGTTVLANIANDGIDGQEGTLNIYYMYIDGKHVAQTCAKTLAQVGYNAGPGLYEVSFDADGVIVAVKDAATVTDLLQSVNDVIDYTGTVIENESVAINCTGAPVYVRAADYSVTVGTDADIVAGSNVIAVMNDAGDMAVALYVIK
ncbi:MAG: S-layer homology domain-containing protein [Ruminiclostridium sp.]|nr:S-layer homology domain-containing protein [Ruminiclostridium sp.]